MHLSRQTQNFIKSLGIQKPLYQLTPEEAREFLINLQSKNHKEIDANIEDKTIQTIVAGEVDVRVVRPKNCDKKLPAILYLHGGGWVMGDTYVFDNPVKKLANKTNAAVIFVNYALSPDFRYPVAINQIYGVLNYVYNNPDEFNIDKNNISIAGDSAGGNMAIATTLRAIAENGVKIKSLALFYPVTSADMKTDSYKEFKNGPWLSKKAMEWFFDLYTIDKPVRESIYISPLKSKPEDIEDFPPTLIITAENDVLRDEGEEFARKLDDAGVETLCIRMNNTHHDFIMLNGLSETPEAKQALEIAANWLKFKNEAFQE